MYKDDFSRLAASGAGKVEFMKKNPAGYVIASMMAGMFIAFGSIVSLTTGGLLHGQQYAKLLAGLTFCAALSLVIFAGCELFTGNNLTVTAAFMEKKITFGEMCRLFAVCYLGNLMGSLVLVVLFRLSGILSGDTLWYLQRVATAKVTSPIYQLFLKGVLCNICVCLAVWCAGKMTSESGKLIMIIWCIMVFMVSGFEHSIANMSILGSAVATSVISVGQFLRNLIPVTLGNITGGILFVAVPYKIMSR